MSIETVQNIIGRAVTEPDYRDLLLGDPEKALEGYELTEDEAAALKGIERETFDTLASELGDRVSMAGIAVSVRPKGTRGFQLSVDGGESWLN